MSEVRYEGPINSGGSSSTLLMSGDEDSQWVACGRKLRRSNTTRQNEHELRHNNHAVFIDLPLELCDPMRRKITFLKPSLTPGAGTRVVRRKKPSKQDFINEPVCDSQEAFRQWREAMRSMARLPEGIPSQFRRKIWLTLATHQLDSQYINWPRLVQTVFAPQSHTSEVEERLGRQIEKDLHRTGFSVSGSAVLGATEVDQTVLKRVLTAYARWNRRVGYCQGFNILASVILSVMEQDEEAALKVMIYLVDYVLPESYFARNLQALSVDVTVFRDLLGLCQPNLAAHLQKLQRNAAIEAMHCGSDSDVSSKLKPVFEPPLTDLYAIQWFVTLFSTSLPMSTVLRIWDAVLLEGSEVGLRAGLVVMEILSEDLMQLTTADKFYSSMNQWLEEIAEGDSDVSTSEFIRLMYDIAPLPWPRLDDLRRRYAAASEGGKGSLPNFPMFYGDGYDEMADQAKTKWWWNVKSRQADEPVKSPPANKARIHFMARSPKDDSTQSKLLSIGSTEAQPQPKGSPCLSEPNSSRYQSADEASPAGLSEPNSPEKAPVNRQHQEQKLSEPAPPLAVNNEHFVPPSSLAEKRRTSYQLDESFLQTINEWQRRNAAALATEEDTSEGEESDDHYATPAEMSPSVVKVTSSTEASPDVPRVGRTLLAIAAQKKLAEMANSGKNFAKSPADTLPFTRRRNSVLAQAIIRDRKQPNEYFALRSPTIAATTVSNMTSRNAAHQSMISPVPHLSSSSLFTTPSPPNEHSPPRTRTNASSRRMDDMRPDVLENSVSPPPWAAAMAAIGASSSRFVNTSKKLTN